MTLSFKGGDLTAMLFGGIIESVESPSAPTISGTPTELDEELLDDVYDIIAELGKTVTFWLYGSDSYNPATGKQSTGDATQYNLKVIPPYEVELKYVDGDLVRIGDLVSGVPAKNIQFIPERGIKVTIDSAIWEIMRVTPIYSGEWICLYIFQLRK
jgi:hypothetical protein